jgi:RHS repeat-associated protein
LRSHFAEGPERVQSTGHERDGESDWDYRGARYYSADYGRFLSVDPLAGKFAGWSPYGYVLGNPVELVDPDGMAPESGPGYSANHPVVKAIRSYNEYIWYAFEGSNNTSTTHFHLHAKGLSGADGRGKAIGAIGEGLFATRLTSNTSETGSALYMGRKIGGLHHDMLQSTNLFTLKHGRFELKVNHTDINGVSRNSKVNVARTGFISQGTISYEVKTLSPKSDPAMLLSQFVTGVSQIAERTNVADAGVLVFDQAAWNVVYNSPHRADLMKAYNSLTGLKNSHGNQVGFLRLENGLYDDSNKSYHALKDQINGL